MIKSVLTPIRARDEVDGVVRHGNGETGRRWNGRVLEKGEGQAESVGFNGKELQEEQRSCNFKPRLLEKKVGVKTEERRENRTALKYPGEGEGTSFTRR